MLPRGATKSNSSVLSIGVVYSIVGLHRNVVTRKPGRQNVAVNLCAPAPTRACITQLTGSNETYLAVCAYVSELPGGAVVESVLKSSSNAGR